MVSPHRFREELLALIKAFALPSLSDADRPIRLNLPALGGSNARRLAFTSARAVRFHRNNATRCAIVVIAPSILGVALRMLPAALNGYTAVADIKVMVVAITFVDKLR